MVSVLLLKLNGWPSAFDERLIAIAKNVPKLVVIRSKPSETGDEIAEIENVSVINLLPKRGTVIKPAWLKPIIFPIHISEAVLVMMYLYLRGRLPTVIHALDYALGGFAAAVISRILSLPLVVSVRGIKETRYKTAMVQESSYSAKIRYKILRILTYFTISSADHIITKAKYQVDFVRDSFAVNPEFTSIPTGVDFDVFNPSRFVDCNQDLNLKGAERTISSDDNIVLYLSSMIPSKGPDLVLEQIMRNQNEIPNCVKFAFVGEFQGKQFEQRFTKRCEALSDRVFLHPYRVSYEKVPKLLNSANAVLLLPEPFSEGVPRILQESCAMQTPIIASNVTGIKDAFEGLPGCYLIDRDEPIQFKTAVNNAVFQSHKMPRELFVERFDIYRNYSLYSNIYEKLGAGT